MSEFCLEVPINTLSFGQVCVGLLVEMFKRGDLNPHIFPIGQPDLSAYDLPEGFTEWLNEKISNAVSHVGKKLPFARCWHLNQSERVLPSKRSVLYTFHECSEVTETEKAIAGFYDRFLVASEYSQDIFATAGIESDYCPPYFDKTHFFKKDVAKQDGVINFSLIGKLEKRKLTNEIIACWAALFGGNWQYRLNCLVFNPFMPQEMQERNISGLFKGNKPDNINILPFMPKNSQVNEFMNFCDIDLSLLSGSEGWGLPGFNALCLGKQCVALNAHAHKSFVTNKNSILIEPSDTREIYDGLFFIKGTPFNQGTQFIFDNEQAMEGMKQAASVYSKNNDEGEKLKDQFPVSRTLDIILKNLFD